MRAAGHRGGSCSSRVGCGIGSGAMPRETQPGAEAAARADAITPFLPSIPCNLQTIMAAGDALRPDGGGAVCQGRGSAARGGLLTTQPPHTTADRCAVRPQRCPARAAGARVRPAGCCTAIAPPRGGGLLSPARWGLRPRPTGHLVPSSRCLRAGAQVCVFVCVHAGMRVTLSSCAPASGQARCHQIGGADCKGLTGE